MIKNKYLNEKIKRLIAPLFIFSFISAGLINCSDDKKKEEVVYDSAGSTAMALEGFQMLATLLDRCIDTLDDTDFDTIRSGDQACSQTDFDAVKVVFEEGISLDPNNPSSNLGMGLIEILGENYNTDLWSIINDIRDEKPGTLFAQRIQNLAEGDALTRVNNALSYLDKAVSVPDDTISVVVSVEECDPANFDCTCEETDTCDYGAMVYHDVDKTFHIDSAEAHTLRAAANLAKAAIKLAVLYDLDIEKSSLSATDYGWLDSLIDGEYCDWDSGLNCDTEPNYYSSVIKDIDDSGSGKSIIEKTKKNESDSAQNDKILFQAIKYTLENDTSFLTRKAGKNIDDVPALVIWAIDDLNAAYSKRKSAPVKDYVLEQSFLDEIDEEILNASTEISTPVLAACQAAEAGITLTDCETKILDFMKSWTSLADALSFAKTVLEGEYTFTKGNGTALFKLNLLKFFESGTLADVETALPYYSWRADANWLTWEQNWLWLNNVEYSKTFTVNDAPVTIDAIWGECEMRYELKPFDLLDGASGAPLADGVDMLYFTDYTVQGILPDMTEAKLQNLIDSIEITINQNDGDFR
ncbi:MAG: hypothetical protein OEZ22_14075 [Spirochaetia bacterium]|nr:hypothetical protein [Spirochaetia bacterium]